MVFSEFVNSFLESPVELRREFLAPWCHHGLLRTFKHLNAVFEPYAPTSDALQLPRWQGRIGVRLEWNSKSNYSRKALMAL
jgi:hypothetical protein